MKKHIIIPVGVCLVLLTLSTFYLHRKYAAQIETQKEQLVWYVSNTKTGLNATLSRSKEVSHIVKPIIGEGDTLDMNITSRNVDFIAQLEQFYIDNNHCVDGISVNDMFGNVFNLYRDKKTGEFIQDTYKSRIAKGLRSETGITVEGNSFSIILPMCRGNSVSGNVSININLDSLHQELFNPYLENDLIWPTSILAEGSVYTFPLDGEWVLSREEEIVQDLQERTSGFLFGRMEGFDRSTRVVTYYESLPVFDRYIGIAFSANISPLIRSFIITMMVVVLVFAALTFVTVSTLSRMIRIHGEAIDEKNGEIRLMQTIYGYAPIAFIVTRNGNFHTANQHFFKYFDKVSFRDDSGKVNFPFAFQPEFADWDLCSFDRDGKEVCLGRRQIDMELTGDRYTIDAFWDVTEMMRRLKNTTHSEITKSELLSRVSTDVKKSLGSVRDAIVLLAQLFPEEEHIGYINRSTADLCMMIDEVQDYANIEAGRIVLDEMPFNLLTEIRKVTNLYQADAQAKGIDLQAQITPSAVRDLVGDPQRFRQVLSGLLSNAVKFTDKGAIRILLETVELQAGKIMVKCSVEDTGRGMSNEKLKTIFSLDLRAKEGESIGLGVIITRKLVNMMGGNIRATSPSPISTDSSMPGMQFAFSMVCYSDQQLDKQLDYSAIVSFSQVNALIIASNDIQMQYLAVFLKQAGVNTDVFIYNKESKGLLINKLIVDRSRYHVVIIAADASETTFAIAEAIHQRGLTKQCIYVMVDTSGRKGNYIRSKSLNMDYYSVKSNAAPILFDSIRKFHFPGLPSGETSNLELVRKDLRILIAENNTLGQTVAKVIFKKLGYEVDFVQDATHLVDQLARKTYDVIFIDLKFPPANGFEIAEKLRLKGYKTPIIAMTATLTRENLKHIADSGMDGYVSKPLNSDSIKQTLIKWFT